MYALRVLLVAFAVMLALSLAIVVQAQGESQEETVTATPAAEAAAMDQEEDAMEAMDDPVAGVDVVGLELGTYHLDWIRFFNSDADGVLILQVEDVTRFPWMQVNNGDVAITVEDLADPDFIAGLIESAEIVYDEELLAGECDAAILLGYRSTDLYCTPGTSVLERGNIYLAIFHPETRELVALTTTIDNTVGGAQVTPQPPAPSAAPTPVSERERSCGPFAAGQWITPTEYENAGVILPINLDGVWGAITDYQCMVPEDAPSYLQAYSILDNGGDGGGGGNGGGNGGGGGEEEAVEN